MDPHAEKVPGLALPKPASEQGMGGDMSYQPGMMPETSLPSIESIAPPVGSPAMAQAPIVAAPVQPVSAASDVPTGISPAPAHATDDNTDALDDEWINKAKAIVEQTKHDPHLESQEIGRVKADYLRIRFNKHIKLAEDHTK